VCVCWVPARRVFPTIGLSRPRECSPLNIPRSPHSDTPRGFRPPHQAPRGLLTPNETSRKSPRGCPILRAGRRQVPCDVRRDTPSETPITRTLRHLPHRPNLLLVIRPTQTSSPLTVGRFGVDRVKRPIQVTTEQNTSQRGHCR